jgi:NADH:ubiquinone oxidoreductase subunit B-like Fe-S oxidoreductase
MKRNGPKPESGRLAELLIVEGKLSDQAIADRVRAIYPQSTMNKTVVQWYRWRLRKEGKVSAL